MKDTLMCRLITIRNGKIFIGENKANKKQVRLLKRKPFFKLEREYYPTPNYNFIVDEPIIFLAGKLDYIYEKTPKKS